MVRRASYSAHKEALLQRLRRMEGQARGLERMIEDERYCLDVIQQINALTAAAREVALIMVEDHLRMCVNDACSEADREAAIREMPTVLGRVVRQ
jgi:DNA-binding FrmR family transcriptional regulator